MQLDEPFKEELSNPRAYKTLNMAHFLEFSESSSKTLFLTCTVICVILITNPNLDPPKGTHTKFEYGGIRCYIWLEYR